VKRGSGATGQRGSGWGRAGLLVFLALLSVNSLIGQSTPPPPRRPAVPQDTALAVYLMTMGPGKQVWERFGHNAIWIHDPVRGTDQTYNYGLFDFHQENFLLRFIQGRMWYWMQGFPAQSYVAQYRKANRSVWVQELEIAPPARQELEEFLEWNERPENRFYHYDYYQDNCSTRVRDALDRALNGQIHESTYNSPSGKTYRFHTQRLTENDPPIYTGLLLALGHPVDRPISVWEEMFLPLALRDHIRKVTVARADGTRVPLVKSERTLFESSEPSPPAAPPHWLLYYLIGGILLGGGAYALATNANRSRLARRAFALLAGLWLLLTGAAGLVLAGLWGLTDHAAAYSNENVLQMNVLALPLLVLLPGVVRAERSRAAVWISLLIAAISLVGLVLKLLPAFYQTNGQIIALALPAHAGIAVGMWILARPRSD
jgi:Domain of unknown function (DUF4105)